MDCVLGALNVIWSWVVSNFSAALAALFGSFSGAYIAFHIEHLHQASKERDAQLIAGKKSQFALVSQLNGLLNIREQHLNKKKDDPCRHLTLPPFLVHREFPRLPIDDLSFLLDKEGVNILNDAMLAEHRFITFVMSLEQRSSRHEQMQYQAARLDPGQDVDKATITILKDLTDSLYGQADDAIAATEQSIRNLKQILEKRFPGSHAFEFKYRE